MANPDSNGYLLERSPTRSLSLSTEVWKFDFFTANFDFYGRILRQNELRESNKV